MKEVNMKKTKKTSDVLAYVYGRYVQGNSKREAQLRAIEADMDVAQQLYDLRTQSGLSQRDLAKLVGTTASVICQLEDSEYKGHSLRMLQRIASVMKQRVVIRFEPMKQKEANLRPV
jgi:ribosome-binding protein aMBF1 (putative translation factor)